MEPARIAGEPIESLLDLLKRPEYRIRYWAKRELRERNRREVEAALDEWVMSLDSGGAAIPTSSDRGGLVVSWYRCGKCAATS